MPNHSTIHADARLPHDGLTIAASGLTAEETRQRLAGDRPKLLPGGQPRTWLAIVGETVREPMFLLLAALYVPWAVDASRFAPLPAHELAAACSLGLVSVLWFEGIKQVRRMVGTGAGTVVVSRR